MSDERGRRAAVAASVVVLALVLPAVAGDGKVTINNRGKDEKKFAAALGTEVVKAAHPSARKITLLTHKTTSPKEGEQVMEIKMGYHGLVSGLVSKKRYEADVKVQIDTSKKDAWKVTGIDYSDNNKIKRNEKKIRKLIVNLNR